MDETIDEIVARLDNADPLEFRIDDIRPIHFGRTRPFGTSPFARMYAEPNKYRSVDKNSVDVIRLRLITEFIGRVFRPEHRNSQRRLQEYIKRYANLDYRIVSDSEYCEAISNVFGSYSGYSGMLAIIQHQSSWYTEVSVRYNKQILTNRKTEHAWQYPMYWLTAGINVDVDIHDELFSAKRDKCTKEEIIRHLHSVNSLIENKFIYYDDEDKIIDFDKPVMFALHVLHNRTLFMKYLCGAIDKTVTMFNGIEKEINSHNKTVELGEYGPKVFVLNSGIRERLINESAIEDKSDTKLINNIFNNAVSNVRNEYAESIYQSLLKEVNTQYKKLMSPSKVVTKKNKVLREPMFFDTNVRSRPVSGSTWF